MYPLHWIKKGYDGYLLSDAKARYEVRELPTGYLILNWEEAKLEYEFDMVGLTIGFVKKKQNGFINFAVAGVLKSYPDQNGILEIELDIQFHGRGLIKNLSQDAYTWWGQDGDGILYRPNFTVIQDGITALSEFFNIDE